MAEFKRFFSKFFTDLVIRAISAVFLLSVVTYVWTLGHYYREIMILIIFSIIFLEWIFLFKEARVLQQGELKLTFLFSIGVFYLILAGIGCWELLQHKIYSELIPSIMLIIWTVDSGSYILGSILKGPKLSPTISANKTWSGFIMGIILGHIMGFKFLYPYIPQAKPIAFILTFFIPFLAQIGDLLESKVKRVVNVKDSSHLIPGHGGILDRLDSTLMIFFAWGVYTLMEYFHLSLTFY